MCVYSKEGEWPRDLFHSWFNQYDKGNPTSSIIMVPGVTNKPTHTVDGREGCVNETYEPPALGFQFGRAFLRWNEKSNPKVLLPGVIVMSYVVSLTGCRT